ncbi:MAG: hypothetical protein GC136_06750 [Alphaproteobacteria bacterium]|nr:hypothetical protein [Alphaproteobacteria bacterium]
MATGGEIGGGFDNAASYLTALQTAWNGEANAELRKILETLHKTGNVKVIEVIGGSVEQPKLHYEISDKTSGKWFKLAFNWDSKETTYSVEPQTGSHLQSGSLTVVKARILGELAHFRYGEMLLQAVQRELEVKPAKRAKGDPRADKPA